VQLPARFGDPLTEYHAARNAAGLIDANFQAVFALTGPDRVRYLNAVTSGNIRDLRPGQSAPGLLLNAQGHILGELLTLATEDRLVILSHQFAQQRTFETLDKFIIMDDATLADETAQTGTLSVVGPRAAQIIQELTGMTIAQFENGGHVSASLQTADGSVPCRVLHRGQFGLSGGEFLLPRESLTAAWKMLEEAVRACGGTAIGYRALNMLRLEAGIPWFGTDFDEHQIPQEAGIEATHVSFTKGCYTGQEIVERVRSRGHVNRRLSGMIFSRTEVPEPGTAVSAPDAGDGSPAADSTAGYITSAAFSPLRGTPIGFGYLRREYSAPGTKLRCGGAEAEVIDLPLKAG
jgi:folate-binding protein YgfZ